MEPDQLDRVPHQTLILLDLLNQLSATKASLIRNYQITNSTQSMSVD